MEEVKEFFVTFGQKYFQQEHPVLGQQLTPDHYVTVFARSEMAARTLCVKELDLAWAFIYEADGYESLQKKVLYPKGEIAVITEHGLYVLVDMDMAFDDQP